MTVYAELLAAAKAVYDEAEEEPKNWERLRKAIEACERKIDGRQLIAESDRLVPRFTESQQKAKA